MPTWRTARNFHILQVTAVHQIFSTILFLCLGKTTNSQDWFPAIRVAGNIHGKPPYQVYQIRFFSYSPSSESERIKVLFDEYSLHFVNIYELKCSLKFASKDSLRNKSLFQKTFQFAQIFASIHTCPCPCPSPCPRLCSCMTMTVSVYMLCMDIYMQHGRRHTALAWTCSMDIQRKHEHRHAVWTRTTRLQHRYGQLDIQRGQDIRTAWRWTIGCETWI
jgi:hypothetical protein